MHYQITLVAAAALFLSFQGLSPHDIRSVQSESESLSIADANAIGQPDPVVASERATSPIAIEETSGDALNPNVAAVENALRVFGPRVSRQSHPDALRYAFRAYYNYRAAHPDQVKNPYFYYVDFGLDSRTARGYVFDMDAQRVIEGPFHVAHGQGSAPGNALLPTRFLNRNGSNATSLGLYLAQETYGFRGRSGGRAYRSIGLRLRGLSGSFNNAARSRGIVVHGAPYVTNERAGRSQGCPAMRPDLAERLIPMIANGGLVFHFSPADARWMREDPWAASMPGLALE